jgi:hypothetical protein
VGGSRSSYRLVLEAEHANGRYYDLGLKLEDWAIVEVSHGGGRTLRRENEGGRGWRRLFCTRETRGIAPDRLETDEIHPYGAQARAAELTATKKKGMPKIATAGKFRPGSKIPKSPTNKKDWEDPTFQAQALAMLHPVHALWRTDAGFLENLYFLQSKALTDADGRFIFYCYAIAVTNTKIPPMQYHYHFLPT